MYFGSGGRVLLPFLFDALCALWPAENREREEAGGEPRVEDVIVAAQRDARGRHPETSHRLRERLALAAATNPEFLLLVHYSKYETNRLF